MTKHGIDFRSDNTAPAAPEILAALAAVGEQTATAYGGDPLTARLQTAFGALFQAPVTAAPVATGIAANALALAALLPEGGAVYCHEDSHIVLAESGAVPFAAGGAVLVGIAGTGGKIDPVRLERRIAGQRRDRGALSLTQATELGTVYSPAEMAALIGIARRHGLAVHVDGARLGNALVSLGGRAATVFGPQAGIDGVSFGATKNGGAFADAVVLFDPAAGARLDRLRERGGHVFSKMRYLSAQLLAYLEGDLWLANAAAANRAARRLGDGLAGLPGVTLAAPVEANMVFVRWPDRVAAALKDRGHDFFDWPDGMWRLLCSYRRTDAEIDRFLADAAELSR